MSVRFMGSPHDVVSLKIEALGLTLVNKGVITDADYQATIRQIRDEGRWDSAITWSEVDDG